MATTNTPYDLVINGGKIVDVLNNTIQTGNIAVSDGKIVRITENQIIGKEAIDAGGLIVSPGFIDFHSHVDGNTYSATCLVKQGGTTTIGGERNLNSKVIKSIDKDGFIVNHGFSVSESFVLRSAVGINSNRAATDSEVKAMVNLARRFLDFGAFGICFGLELVPGTSFEEILALAKVAKEYDRPIIVHLRKDGTEALPFFKEVIKVAEMTGVSVQILQLMYMVGINGAMETALEIIENARARGLDITADSGLYHAFSVCIGTGVFDEGWENEYNGVQAKDLLISSGIHMGQFCDDELFTLLRSEYPETLVSAFVCDKDAIVTALVKNYVYVSTNAADGPHYYHTGAPEVSGTFPRLLGYHVRERNDLTLIDAIKKITILPAQRYGISKRGYLAEGCFADIVIFDEKNIIDKANFLDKGVPDAPPEGISYVIVNGKIVVEYGEIIEGNSNRGHLLKRGNV